MDTKVKTDKLVSIITPLFNNEVFLSDCINSVLNQTYTNWEMLIVDDCSTDDSYRLANEYSKEDPRIQVFQLDENSGSGPARNLAIKKAKGSYVAFLDSDDIWHEDKLRIQVNAMLTSNAVISHTSYGYMLENGIKLKKTLQVGNRLLTYRRLLMRTEIGCLTAMYNVELIGKVYMPSLRRKQDFALWLMILREGHVSLPIRQTLAWYRQVKGSATSQKLSLRVVINHYFFLRRTQHLGRINSTIFTLSWGINGIIRHYIK